MTELDLAAIKARADAAADYGDAADQVRSAADVPALLARITELEAERDHYRAAMVGLWGLVLLTAHLIGA